MLVALPGEWISAVVLAPFIGSFLATLAVRLPKGEDVVFSRSRCRACAQTLGARDLVPIVSWFVSSGRCTHCRARIDSIYPLVEVTAAGIALWAATATSGAVFWITCALGWTLLALAVMDLREMVLSDWLTLPLIAAGLVVAAVFDTVNLPDHAIGALAGFALLGGVALLYRRFRGDDGLGWGDAKLFAATGAWLSWTALGGVLLIGAIVTLAAAGAAPIFGRSLNAKSALVFGPGLALGFWLSWLYGPVFFA